MKTIILMFALATSAFADYRKDAGEYIARDTGRLVAWLNEPVAFSNVTTYTTNTVQKSAEMWAAESYLGSLWANVGGSVTNSFETNLGILKAAAAQASPEVKDQLRDLAIEIVALYAKLKAEGCEFNGLAPGAVTSITASVMQVPTRYRWQDYGFKNAPTVGDLK